MKTPNAMKVLLLGLFVVSFASAALALDKAELDRRIHKLCLRFAQMQQKPDKRIRAQTLQAAKAIILLDRTKAGFIFAYQGGSGLAMVKDKKSGQWGPAAFLKADEASLGFQVGGQQSFIVILLMDPNGTRLLSDPTFEFGGEARGTAGGSSAGVEGTIASAEKSVLVYDDRKGFYGGAAIKGGAVSPDEEANLAYYEQPLTMRQILFGNKVRPTEATAELGKRILEQSSK
ncbi:MAG: lipid-binding SYLF domain-containing protein [Verrucomicrobia bacterium]|nr:lipid-binding SYLF domain-containing protein [Verrucomicrobiota bacterium]